MNYGICLMSVVPMREMPEHRSEQVTQLIFGDMVNVLEKRNSWYFVQVLSDSYQGWIADGQIQLIEPSTCDMLHQQNVCYSSDLIQLLENKSKSFSFMVSAGSTFYGCKDNSFDLLGDKWYFHGQTNNSTNHDRSKITDNAMLFLHTPYQWGGKSAMGMDCSGFTQMVYKMSGIQIHRDASQQATQGETVNLIHEALPGDLLFFDNDEGIITHTGIMGNNEHIIHAYHKVRIDKIDHHGIFNLDTRKYTHQLRIIKRF